MRDRPSPSILGLRRSQPCVLAPSPRQDPARAPRRLHPLAPQPRHLQFQGHLTRHRCDHHRLCRQPSSQAHARLPGLAYGGRCPDLSATLAVPQQLDVACTLARFAWVAGQVLAAAGTLCIAHALTAHFYRWLPMNILQPGGGRVPVHYRNMLKPTRGFMFPPPSPKSVIGEVGTQESLSEASW
jgi:hypothetical protein